MVENDLAFARRAIISGKLPLKIKRYRRRRLFWVIFGAVVLIWLSFNLSGTLPWKFWKGALALAPVFLLLAVVRRLFVVSSGRDLLVIAAALAVLGAAQANGLVYAGFPVKNCLPTNLAPVFILVK